MDFLVSKEIEALKGDKVGSDEAIEADKFAFQHKLMGDMGKQMMEELNHPKKPSKLLGLKYRIARWKTIREEKKKERELKKKIKKGDI